MSEKNSIHNISVTKLDGTESTLAEYRGKVLLIVNVASKCGFTPQYKELQALYERFQAEGLEILGFPCNQFAAQEPGDAEEIKSFCTLNYGVSFPLYAKVAVNGAHTHPLYHRLKQSCPGIMGTSAVKWNFTKFLVGRDGVPRARFAPSTSPSALEGELRALLAEGA